MAWFLRVIGEMRGKTGMYLREPSVSLFKAFLGGYMSARFDLGLPSYDSDTERKMLDGFHYWIAMKFDSYGSRDWSSIIDHFYSHEEDTMSLFYSLWDQYLKEYNQKGYKRIEKDFWEAKKNYSKKTREL